VLNKKCKQTHGFYYSLNELSKKQIIKNLKNLTITPKNKKYINIKQSDVDGNILKIWKDVREIIDSLEYSSNGPISNAIKNNKKYKGFYWTLN